MTVKATGVTVCSNKESWPNHYYVIFQPDSLLKTELCCATNDLIINGNVDLSQAYQHPVYLEKEGIPYNQCVELNTSLLTKTNPYVQPVIDQAHTLHQGQSTDIIITEIGGSMPSPGTLARPVPAVIVSVVVYQIIMHFFPTANLVGIGLTVLAGAVTYAYPGPVTKLLIGGGQLIGSVLGGSETSGASSTGPVGQEYHGYSTNTYSVGQTRHREPEIMKEGNVHRFRQ